MEAARKSPHTHTDTRVTLCLPGCWPVHRCLFRRPRATRPPLIWVVISDEQTGMSSGFEASVLNCHLPQGQGGEATHGVMWSSPALAEETGPQRGKGVAGPRSELAGKPS